VVRPGKDRGEWRFAQYPLRMRAYLKVQRLSTSMIGPMPVVVSSSRSHIPEAEAEALLIPASVVLTLRKLAKGEAAGFGVVQRWVSPPCSGFASVGWFIGTHEYLDPTQGGLINSPTNLQNAINTANGSN
jgi:hypothetical protein